MSMIVVTRNNISNEIKLNSNRSNSSILTHPNEA